jgi:hypothetical protein
MAAAIALRADYESTQLRELARQSEDADQVRRLLALALVYLITHKPQPISGADRALVWFGRQPM